MQDLEQHEGVAQIFAVRDILCIGKRRPVYGGGVRDMRFEASEHVPKEEN
jgi:hypothetical protein